jgi:hypothetical protein
MDPGTDFEFRTAKFGDPVKDVRTEDDTSLERNLAYYLYGKLQELGIGVERPYRRDSLDQWVIPIRSNTIVMWIGCGHYKGYDDYFFGYINPTPPPTAQKNQRGLFRLFFKTKDSATAEDIGHLAKGLDAILAADKEIEDLNWWTDQSRYS